MGIFDTVNNPFVQSQQSLAPIHTGTVFDPLIALGSQFRSQNNDRLIAEQAKAAQAAKIAREDKQNKTAADAKILAAKTSFGNQKELANLKIANAQKVKAAKEAKALELHGKTADFLIKRGQLKPSERQAFIDAGGASGLVKKGQNIKVQVGSGENAASKAFGTSIGNAAVKLNEQAMLATKNNSTLDRLEQSLNTGAKTGIGRETLGNIRNLAQSFGVNLDAGFKSLGIKTSSLSEEQVINALGNQLALQLRDPKSGGGLPGATSNRDLEFLKAAVPGLSRTPEGNRALISMARKLNGMKIAVAQKQAEIISNNGGQIPLNLEAQLVDFANNMQLFTDQERQTLSSASDGGSPVTVTIKGKGEITFPSQDAFNTFKSKFPDMVQ